MAEALQMRERGRWRVRRGGRDAREGERGRRRARRGGRAPAAAGAQRKSAGDGGRAEDGREGAAGSRVDG